jgi:hypothetical protein
VAVLLIAVRPWYTLTLQPWRGTYYARSDQSGKWQMRYDREIDFDWGRDAPIPDWPVDRFSVRWDSCLHLDAPTKAVFQSNSDDGSRVYVDGDLIVLNRTKGKTQSRGGEAQLEAGVHHVRGDYSEFSGDAHVQVLASFDDDPPRPIPASMLHAPRGLASEDDRASDECDLSDMSWGTCLPLGSVSSQGRAAKEGACRARTDEGGVMWTRRALGAREA